MGHIARSSPLQVGVAAGVVGTLSVTGTVVANAADGSNRTVHPRAKPISHSARTATDLVSVQAQQSLHDAVTSAADQRRADVAKARAKKARERAQAKRQAARKAADRASSSRSFSSASASRGVERMSPSASHVLAIARQAAAGAYYAHGGSGPQSFDCSGFTMYVFSQMGISLPHSSSAQRGMVTSVSSPQPGDLVFVYNGGGGSIGHVAIYAGGGYWYEAANPSVGVGYHRAWSTAVSYGRVL